MTDFKDRERAEEAKFALDNDTAFRIAARRNRLLGEWAAGLMKLTPEETDAYRKAVVQADFEESGMKMWCASCSGISRRRSPMSAKPTSAPSLKK